MHCPKLPHTTFKDCLQPSSDDIVNMALELKLKLGTRKRKETKGAIAVCGGDRSQKDMTKTVSNPFLLPFCSAWKNPSPENLKHQQPCHMCVTNHHFCTNQSSAQKHFSKPFVSATKPMIRFYCSYCSAFPCSDESKEKNNTRKVIASMLHMPPSPCELHCNVPFRTIRKWATPFCNDWVYPLRAEGDSSFSTLLQICTNRGRSSLTHNFGQPLCSIHSDCSFLLNPLTESKRTGPLAA